MKAAFFDAYGDASHIRIGEQPKPIPKENDVLIKVIASGVNPIDWKIRKGHLKFLTRKKFPFITGADFVGTVESVGKKVKRFKVGDKVLGQTTGIEGGATAEYCVVDTSRIIHVPTEMKDEEAAGLSLAGQTSYQALVDCARLQKNQSILIIGASGATGQMAVQIARGIGAKVTAVCSQKNHDLVKSIGANTLIDYKTTDFRASKEHYDVIYDCVGQDTPFSCNSVLNKKGVFLTIIPTAKNLFPLLYAKALSMFGLAPKVFIVLLKTKQSYLEALVTLINQDKLRVIVDKVFPLNETENAHRYSESQRARGKIIIKI